ncbi:MAG TPA: GDSL-type esterase/lipase family protein [Bacillota bacterium]|nr:GDSL-type esterase/lipase family protein [Bacillota bacterium]
MGKKFFLTGLAICFIVSGALIGYEKISISIAQKIALDSRAEDLAALQAMEYDGDDGEFAPADASFAEILPTEAVSGPLQNTENPPFDESRPASGEGDSGEEAPEEPLPPADTLSSDELEALKRRKRMVEYQTVGTDYFSDALMVGDSRMVGIREYSGLKEPTYFAYTGLTIFGLDNKELDVKNIGKTTFTKLISNHHFAKIYIMLGINEAGSKLSDFAKKYDSVVADIQEKQPEAIIFLCANLYVTKSKSERDKTYANSHIDEINAAIEIIAGNYGCYYLDVNPLFSDGAGNLSTEYAADYAHMYGKHYRTWVDWLCSKGVVYDDDTMEIDQYIDEYQQQ